MKTIYDRSDASGGKYRIVEISADESESITKEVNHLSNGFRMTIYSVHAEQRMVQRKIDHNDVHHVLEKGRHIETREYENDKSISRFKFEGFDFDQKRKVSIVFVDRRDKYKIITVME